MLYDGQYEIGLKTMSDIRARYDGKKRNPFNEAEWGNHYARSMMAWGSILACTGFHYSAVDKSMRFTDKAGKYFWSNGYQYGTIEVRDKEDDKSVLFSVLNGEISLKSFSLNGFGKVTFKKGKIFKEKEPVLLNIDKGGL
jgi:hypothetical protein